MPTTEDPSFRGLEPDPRFTGLTPYVVIDVHGKLRCADPDADPFTSIDHEVGGMGSDRVRLLNSLGLAAYVSDVGLLDPVAFPRNPIGGCVLVALGANPQPYAGPIYICGWDEDATARGDLEIRKLTPEQLRELYRVLRHVTAALSGDNTPPPAAPANWPEHIRGIAEMIRTAQSPGLRVVDGEEAEQAVRRMFGHVGDDPRGK